MKKVLILLIAGFLLLPFTGCDTGTSPSNPVNPVQPAEPTLGTGSLVLTIADPGVTPVFDDGNDPYAVITGATSTGATFRWTVTVDESTETLTIGNLEPGTWNIKVKVWDNLYSEDDDDDGDGIPNMYDDTNDGGDAVILEDVVALGYETAVVSADSELSLSVNLYTQDDVNDLLSVSDGVFETYNIPEATSEDDDVRRALTWGIYALIAYDEEFLLDCLAEATEEELTAAVDYVTSFSDATSLLAELVRFLGETDEELGTTYLAFLNDVLGLEYEAANYGTLFAAMISEIAADVVGDYEFLLYDLIELDMSHDADTLVFSVSSDYDDAAGLEYSWYLNGVLAGTGASLTLETDDCQTGLNYLSVQLVYGDTVIVGTDSLSFEKESGVERLKIEDIAFDDNRLDSAVSAIGYTYADEVTTLALVNYEDMDFTGIEYLVNLTDLYITNGGTFTESQLTPLYSLTNLKVLLFRNDQPDADLLATLKANMPDVTFYLQ